MTRRSTGTVRKRGDVWHVRYYVDGQRFEESAETGDERAARSLLAQRRREIADGSWKAPHARTAAARVEAARESLEAAIAAAPEGAPITLSRYLDGWTMRRREAGVRNARAEAQWFAMYVTPTLGARSLASITRLEIKDLVDGLTRTTSKKTGRVLAARSVLHVYRTLATAFADAVLDALSAASPCTLKTRKGELPKKRDGSSTWRAQAVYSLAEAEHVLTDPRVPADRRAFCALELLAGLRANEACGRRWRDYDASAEPLGRLTVATQADGADADRDTKTGDVREVPVVPALASILDDWRRVGFPLLFGRHVEPDDPIVPTRHDMTGRSFRNPATTHDRLLEDLKRIEARRVPHAQHSMRATFLSRLEAVGANMAIARRATHAAPSDVVGGYIRTSWADLCREVGKLDIEIRRAAKVIPLHAAKASNGGSYGGSDDAVSEEAANQVDRDGPRWIRTNTRPVMSGEL